MDNRLSGQEKLDLYVEAITNMQKNPHIPQLFRDIFKGAFLPFRDPRTLTMFLKEINEFEYDHSENLGNAFEYLLSVLGSQGDAGQFRTPRHIIDFIVEVVAPKKNDTILDPACGTAGFLISAYKHILKTNSSDYKPETEKVEDKIKLGETATETVIEEKKSYNGDLLTPDDRKKLTQNITGYDISPDMVKLALVNLYLHGFTDPKIHEYDTLSSDKRWDEMYDIILANPPFMTPKGGISPHKRFSIQAKRSEVLFVDYIAEHLTIKGKAGIIVPEGIIFQSANAYKNLRKNLIENWGLYAVVSLPGGVFQPYSGVKTSILLMDREFAKRTDEILFVKVENDGFDLGAQRRKIEKNDLPDALKALESWKQSSVIPSEAEGSLAFAVSKEKIAENGEYNLTCDRYRKIVDYSNTKWPMVELGEVCVFNPKKSEVKKIDQETLVSFVPMADLKEHKIEFTVNKRKKLKDVYSGYTYFVENDVLLARVTPCFENGKSGIARNLENGIGFGSSEYFVYRADKEKTLPEWIYIFISSDNFIENGKKNMSGTGGLQRLTKEYAIKYKIPLPPLEVQKQIVSEIEQYQKVIDGAKQVVENWKPSFRIDPDWPMVKLGDICDVRDGTHGSPKYKTEGIPLITSKNLKDDTIDFKNVNYISEEDHIRISKRSEVDDGDVLFAMIGTIGNPIVVKKDREFSIKNVALFKFQGNTKLNNQFLKVLLSSKFTEENLVIKSRGGTQNFVSLTDIRNFKIPLPSIGLQEQVVAEIEAEQKAVEECKKLIKKMEKKIEAKISEVWSDEI